ncbi:MAG: hypothetical protein ACYTF0_05380 [Planctomycetota bacterium]|jgi:hypothetical protein
MHAERYRCDDRAALLAALTTPSLLERYVAQVEDTLRMVLEEGQAGLLQRCSRVLSRLAAEGMDGLAASDPAALDMLLTDVFAVATWSGWSLPAVADGHVEVDPAAAQRGLLGAEASDEGAILWLLADGALALVRSRPGERRITLRENRKGSCGY